MQADDAQKELTQYSWDKRRRFMYLIAAFCVVVVIYVLMKDMQSSVAETAVTMAFLCLGSIAGSYIFGAAWQDVNHIKATSRIMPGRGPAPARPLRPGDDGQGDPQ